MLSYKFVSLRDTLFFMKETKCYLCSSNNYRLMIIKSKYRILRCNNCDFVFTTPIPNKENLDAFYSTFDYKDSSQAEKVIRLDARRSIQKIDQYAIKKEMVLDVGCGRGYFLDEARKLGWSTYGVDASRIAVDYATKQLNLDVFCSDIFSFQPGKSFDLITLNQVIEHFSNPEIVISQCAKYLKSGGLMYVATPNVESLSARVLKDNFDHFIPPEHLSYFSQRTLQRLFEKLGFSVLYKGSWSYPSDIAGIIKTLLGKKSSLEESSRVIDRNRCELERGSNFPNSNIKQVKSFLFDQVFCRLFYKVLNFDSWGINLELLATKL